MTTRRVGRTARARDGLVAVAFLVAVIALWAVWFWLVPLEWFAPRVG